MYNPYKAFIYFYASASCILPINRKIFSYCFMGVKLFSQLNKKMQCIGISATFISIAQCCQPLPAKYLSFILLHKTTLAHSFFCFWWSITYIWIDQLASMVNIQYKKFESFIFFLSCNNECSRSLVVVCHIPQSTSHTCLSKELFWSWLTCSSLLPLLQHCWLLSLIEP